jgi:hypothetical protein
MRKKIRNLILLQQAIILALVGVLGFAFYVHRKQDRVISVLIDAVYQLQQSEERRADREAAPARRTDVRTY